MFQPAAAFIWHYQPQQCQWIRTPNNPLATQLWHPVSVFTTWRWPLPVNKWRAHIQRVQHHAHLFGLSVSTLHPTAFNQLLESTLPSSTHWRCRLTALPQETIKVPPLLTPPLTSTPLQRVVPSQWWLTVAPLNSPPSLSPLKLGWAHYQKPFPHIKHGDMARAWQLKQHAQQSGLDDLLWVNPQGYVTEATHANVFFETVNAAGHPVWVTPPLGECLAGIERAHRIKEAQAQGIVVKENLVPIEAVGQQFTQGFLTNSVQGQQPFFCTHPLPYIQISIPV
ncbi:MAG: aminotransferase class IV [Vampirovibrionales bacterium]